MFRSRPWNTLKTLWIEDWRLALLRESSISSPPSFTAFWNIKTLCGWKIEDWRFAGHFCVNLQSSIRGDVHMHMYVYIGIWWMWIWVWRVCTHLFVHIYMCMWVYLDIYIYIYIWASCMGINVVVFVYSYHKSKCLGPEHETY